MQEKTIQRTSKPEPSWHCPAVGITITEGLCWEYGLAGAGGPTETTVELRAWIADGDKFSSLRAFHLVCSECGNCPWRSDTKRSETPVTE